MSKKKATPTTEGFSIVANKPKENFPALSLFIGLPKIGKSTAMAKVPKALILDLEGNGYDGIEVDSLVRATDLSTAKKAIKFFFSEENTDYRVLVIDHLRMLTSYFAKTVSNEYKVPFPEKAPYGQGVAHLKYSIEQFLRSMNKKLAEHPDKFVMIVAHAIDRNAEIRLDVDGKNENHILANVHAVGYISRDTETSSTTIDFQAREGVEFGGRNPHLAGYKGELDWSYLFKLAQGKVEQKDAEK